MRLQRGEATLAWAKQARYWSSLAWARTQHAPLAIIPPIRTSAKAPASWPGYFARALEASPSSPCGPGRWELNAHVHGRLPYPLRGLAHASRREASFLVPWTSRFDWESVVALRSPSAPDAARVKAWRKYAREGRGGDRAREGALPPALLWWVAGLETYVILDGHDRVQAASLEGVSIAAITLAMLRRDEVNPEWAASASARYARIFEHEDKLSLRSRMEAAGMLLDGHAAHPRFVTHARSNPSLPALFNAAKLKRPEDVQHLFEE